MIDTPRLKTHVLSNGVEQGQAILFIHGNVSSALFWEETMLAMPSNYQVLAPDLRGFGHSETKPVDATRGLRDFADDVHSLVETLGLAQVNLVGWSLGGGVVLQYALDHPERVASLVLVAPVSPYGFGSTKDVAGSSPCWSDFAGSGGGTANPEFVKRLSEGDRSEESQVSPRNVMNGLYFKPPFRPSPEREEVFVSALLATKCGPDNYPGDLTPSQNWPTVAPGSKGVLNAISPKYFNLSGLADITPKPKILWLRGDSDQIVSDTSLLDFGTLGQIGVVPGWPGAAVFPPQPMVSQMRAILEQYQANGGEYWEEVFTDCGHSPHIEKPEAFRRLVIEFWGE
jgi:pimeloyl-ACP methyl ester carboxylesterase